MHGKRIRNDNVEQHAVLVIEDHINMYGPRIKRVINLLQVMCTCVLLRGVK